MEYLKKKKLDEKQRMAISMYSTISVGLLTIIVMVLPFISVKNKLTDNITIVTGLHAINMWYDGLCGIVISLLQFVSLVLAIGFIVAGMLESRVLQEGNIGISYRTLSRLVDLGLLIDLICKSFCFIFVIALASEIKNEIYVYSVSFGAAMQPLISAAIVVLTIIFRMGWIKPARVHQTDAEKHIADMYRALEEHEDE